MNGVRWSDELGGFEGRCDACLDWWPLLAECRECWPVTGRGLRICRACDNLKTRERLARHRQRPEVREADRVRSRAYMAALTPDERRAMRRSNLARLDAKRAYQREWMRRKRAQAA